MAFAVFFGTAVLFPATVFGGKSNLAHTISNIRYGNSGVLPQGDFTHLSGFTPSQNIMLELVMSQPESYYLRGFVGEVYTGTGWRSLDNSAKYESADLFYWLHRAQFYGQTQIANLAQILRQTPSNTVHIQNIGACRAYIYAPYETFTAQENLLLQSGIGDTVLTSGGLFGQQYYRLQVLPNQIKCYTELASELYAAEQENSDNIKDYLSAQAHYNAYVYQSYLTIPQETRTLLASLVGEYEGTGTHMDYGTAKQNILSFLTANCTYSTESEESRADFLSTFFVQKRSGYSVHFATAATMLFRYYGIPARYVEGYLVTPQDVKNASANTAITIDETHAHAWTEFYRDGIGWIPFETTPVYLDVMERAEDFSGTQVQNGVKSNENNSREQQLETEENQGVQEMSEQNVQSVLTVTLVFVGGIGLLALLVGLFFFMRYRRRKKQLFASFEGEDLRLAVKNMFAYSMELLRKRKILNMSNDAYNAQEQLCAHFGQKYASQYVEALAVYEKAAFGIGTIAEGEQICIRNFWKQTQIFYKQKQK